LPNIISNVDDFPAPVTPSRANTSPDFTPKEIPSTALEPELSFYIK